MHDDVALLQRARLDRREAVLLGVEHARGAAVVRALVARELDDAALGREVAVEDREAAGRLDRVLDRHDDLLAGRLLGARGRARRACRRRRSCAPAWIRSRFCSSRATRPMPPASYMSVATNSPPGLRLATIGVRAATRSKSSSVNSMPSSRAIAIRCSTPFVEPPVAATQAAAFSSASRVISCEGRRSRRTTSITSRPAAIAASALRSCVAGMPESAAGLMPRKSSAHRHRVGGELPPQAPAPGRATDSSSCSSAAVIVPPR